jgi:DNA-binding transcriptional LysR family regulator
MGKANSPKAGVQLPHLESFSRAAELASFTKAAEVLCMTQGAVSQHIQALERELNVPLFRRHAGRVQLTDAGRRLYDYAQRILALHAEARRDLGQSSGEVRGELRIAASTIPAQHFLASLLAEFRKLHPEVHVVANVADSEVVSAMVESGTVSIGLVGVRGSAPWAEYQLFATDRLALVVPSNHRWQKLDSVTIDQIRSEPLVIRETGSGTRACFERAIASRKLTLADFTISMELGNNEAIKDAVFRGLGASVLSVFSVEAELAAGRLHELTLPELDLTRELYALTDQRRAMAAPARAFKQFLASRTPSPGPHESS